MGVLPLTPAAGPVPASGRSHPAGDEVHVAKLPPVLGDLAVLGDALDVELGWELAGQERCGDVSAAAAEPPMLSHEVGRSAP